MSGDPNRGSAPSARPASGSNPVDDIGYKSIDMASLAEPSIRFALATVAIVVTLTMLSITRLPPAQITGGLVVVAGIAASGLRVRWQVAIALVAWAFLTGFVYGQYGELTFDRSDLARLGLLLVAIPSIAQGLAFVHRRARRGAE